MPRIRVHKIRPRKPFPPDTRKALAILREAMAEEIKPLALEYHERIVASWDTEVTFQAKVNVSLAQTSVDVWPTQNAQIWKFVTLGTPPHIIRPKPTNRRGRLFFPTGYQPHTSPGGHYGGAGTATGPLAVASEVAHPGSKPRDFEKHIARWLKPEFNRIMKNAMQRAKRAI